jgi:hypothetical protein
MPDVVVCQDAIRHLKLMVTKTVDLGAAAKRVRQQLDQLREIPGIVSIRLMRCGCNSAVYNT